MKQYAFICGGADPSDLTSADQVFRMDLAGTNRNVNLRLTDVSRALVSDLPDLLVDLLNLPPTYIAPISARDAGPRSSRWPERHGGANFTSSCRLDVVTHGRARPFANVWKRCSAICRSERLPFEFVDSSAPVEQVQSYFTELSESSGFEPEDVVLFSGGLNSLTGAVGGTRRWQAAGPGRAPLGSQGRQRPDGIGAGTSAEGLWRSAFPRDSERHQ